MNFNCEIGVSGSCAGVMNCVLEGLVLAIVDESKPSLMSLGVSAGDVTSPCEGGGWYEKSPS